MKKLNTYRVINGRIYIMRKIVYALLTVSLVLIGTLTLQAQPAAPRQKQEQATREKIGAKLNLTDAQKKQLDEMRTSMKRNAVQLRCKIQLARIDLRELLKADEPNEAVIEKKLNEIGQLQTEQKMLRINHWLNVKKMLTPEQRKIMKSEIRGMWLHGGNIRGNHRGMIRQRRELRMNHRDEMGNPQGSLDNREDMIGNPMSILEDDEYTMDNPPGTIENNDDLLGDPEDPMENGW